MVVSLATMEMLTISVVVVGQMDDLNFRPSIPFLLRTVTTFSVGMVTLVRTVHQVSTKVVLIS